MSDEWKSFFYQLKKQIVSPFDSVIFVLYFTVFLVGIGGIGHWINISRALSDAPPEHGWFLVLESMCIFSITLGSAAIAEIVLKSKVNVVSDCSEKEPMDTILRFFYMSLFMVILSFSVVGLIQASNKNAGSFLYSIVAYLLCLFVWWIVNSDNPNLNSRFEMKKITHPDYSYMNDDSANTGFKL